MKRSGFMENNSLKIMLEELNSKKLKYVKRKLNY